MAILVQQSEATATLRRMYFHCVDATDGISAEVGENGGQPQYSLNGGAWGNTTNTLVAIGNGRYYVEMVAATEVNAVGIIEGRYKSAETAESVGTTLQVVPYDPYDAVRMGLTALPNANADAAGGLPISDLGGIDLDAKIGALTFTTANQVDANALAISSDTAAANNLEADYDGTGYIHILRGTNIALNTTLAVRTSDTVFTIAAGSGDNDAYKNMVLGLYDVTGTLWQTRKIDGYVGVGKTITVDTAFTFVVANGDYVRIFQNAYAPTVAAGGGATAQQVHEYDVSGITTQGQAGYEIQQRGGRY